MEVNILNVETSANIAYSENKVSNKQVKTILAVNNERQSIESHEHVHNLAYWLCLPSKIEAQTINIKMFIVLESEMITLILSQNYDSYISRQLLNSFKTLTCISLI